MPHHLIWKFIGIAARIAKDNYVRSGGDFKLSRIYGSITSSSNKPAEGPKSWELDRSGDEELDKGNYVAAIGYYDAAIAIDPNRVYYFIHRGIAKAKLGDTEGALTDYSIAKRLHPVEFARRAGKGLPGYS